MKCKKCNAPLKSGWVFCPLCGARHIEAEVECRVDPRPNVGSYGTAVRAQVFEVIVRQALSGAPWRRICEGPMAVNDIAPEEVEDEVRRRRSIADWIAGQEDDDSTSKNEDSSAKPVADQRLRALKDALAKVIRDHETDDSLCAALAPIMAELDAIGGD